MKSQIKTVFRSRNAQILIVVLALVLLLLGYLLWEDHKSRPRWTTTREGEAAVFSMATGYDVTGKEILLAGGYVINKKGKLASLVTCQEIENGEIRWEIQKPALQQRKFTSANVAIGSTGEIFVGWGASSGEHGTGGTISRLSGKDGKAKWVWSPGDGFDRVVDEIHVPVPVPSPDGKVWVAWQSKGQLNRVNVAAIGGKTGGQLCGSRVEFSDDASHNYRNVALQTLEDGDALLIVSPREGGSSRQSWWVQRLSHENGNILWQIQIRRTDEWAPPEFRYHVDKENNRLVASCHPDGLGRPPEFFSIDLITGRERWTRGLAGHDPVLTRLTDHGDLEFWTKSERLYDRISWKDWGNYHGLPWPQRTSGWEYGYERFTLSGENGAVSAGEADYSGRDHHSIRLENPGMATREIFSAGGSFPATSPYWIRSGSNWSSLDARCWFHDKNSANSPAICYRAIRSLSGNRVLSRISWKQYSRRRDHKWEIQVW